MGSHFLKLQLANNLSKNVLEAMEVGDATYLGGGGPKKMNLAPVTVSFKNILLVDKKNYKFFNNFKSSILRKVQFFGLKDKLDFGTDILHFFHVSGHSAGPDLSKCCSKNWSIFTNPIEVEAAMGNTIHLYGGDIEPLLELVAKLTEQFRSSTRSETDARFVETLFI